MDKGCSDSNDSVYDSTYQNIDARQNPLLRAAKLTKRIRKDKRVTVAQLKSLKTRRNIITFRIRKKRMILNEELHSSVIPLVQSQVRTCIQPLYIHQE